VRSRRCLVRDVAGESELAAALEGARSASRLTRIGWRDRIAVHGDAAIEAVSPWVADPELGAFAVRVIEATAKFSEVDAAVAALASVARLAPSPAIRGDVQAALERLRPPRPRTGSPRARIPDRAGWSWPGFQPTDFGRVEGTSWRRSKDPVGLIPLLLRPLLELDPSFISVPIYMSPEVHLAVRDRYLQGDEWIQGWRASKLVVYAHGPTVERPDDRARVTAGWYIEKGSGDAKYGAVEPSRWDWPLLLDLLRDPVRRAPLEEAAMRHGLEVGDYLGGRFTEAGATCGFIGAIEDARLVIRSREDGGVAAEGWDGLVHLLEKLPATEWHDLHFWREWPSDEAVAMGQPFAHRALAPVLTDLARIYIEVIR
jgi:hypothetical protein